MYDTCPSLTIVRWGVCFDIPSVYLKVMNVCFANVAQDCRKSGVSRELPIFNKVEDYSPLEIGMRASTQTS